MRSTVRGDRVVREALVQLAGLRAPGQQNEPAWPHPFPARMPVSIAEHLIGATTTAKAVVLDPMVGSGTSVVAAKRLGRVAFGFERDPLSLRIARSVVASLESRRLERLSDRILKRAQDLVGTEDTRLSRLLARMFPEDRQFIRYWFPSESQKQLSALASAIEEETRGAEKDFAWVVFSGLIIAKSAGASYALDLPRSRPHKRLDKTVVLPFDAWSRRFRIAMARLPFRDQRLTAVARVVQGDVRKLPLEDRAVDLVLTSPPYLNAIDYLRAHKFALVWMGYSLARLRELRGTMVGAERGLWSLDGLPSGLEGRLKALVNVDRQRALRRRYLSDLNTLLAEIARVLRPNGLALLVLGPTIISAKRSDATTILDALGERVGLTVVGSVSRYLRAANRSLPPPHVSTPNHPLSNRMRREVIVALRK